MARISILIVEDVPVMRAFLRQLVSSVPEFQVSGVAGHLAEARRELLKNRPGLVLLDEVLPGESAWDLIPELQGLKIRVLLMTGVGESEGEGRPLPPGVLGRLTKPAWKKGARGPSERAFLDEILRYWEESSVGC